MSASRERQTEKIQRYRNRAEECRVQAAEMHDPDARAGLIQVAESYENMARSLEAKILDD
jgi:hypothetical protein